MKTTDLYATKLSIIADLIKIDDVDALSSIKRYISGKKSEVKVRQQ